MTNHKCLLQQSQATPGAVCLLSDSLHSSQVLLHTTESNCTLSIHMQCYQTQAYTKAWLCLYHLSLKRQTAALKYAANTVLITFSFQLAILRQKRNASQHTNSDLSLKWPGTLTDMSRDARTQEEKKLFWHWHSAWITVTFPYDHEAVINLAKYLEDIYRKTLHTLSVVITAKNCPLPLSHFSCQGLLQWIMLKASYSSTILTPLKRQGGNKILL